MQSGKLLRVFVQSLELAPQHGTGFEQRPGYQFQSGMAGDQLPDTLSERAFAGLADLQAKAAEHAAQAVLDVAQLRLQQLARGQNSTRLLCFDRLAVYRTEPAQSHQL